MDKRPDGSRRWGEPDRHLSVSHDHRRATNDGLFSRASTALHERPVLTRQRTRRLVHAAVLARGDWRDRPLWLAAANDLRHALRSDAVPNDCRRREEVGALAAPELNALEGASAVESQPWRRLVGEAVVPLERPNVAAGMRDDRAPWRIGIEHERASPRNVAANLLFAESGTI